MARYSLGVIILVGSLIRAIFLGVNLEVMTLPQGGADAVGFERAAWKVAEYGVEDVTTYLRSSSDFIVLIGSAVYSITGRQPYVLGIIMILLGVGVIYFAYRAALELWEDVHVARAIAWGAALFPQLVLHSVLFLREIPVSFCLAGASWCTVRYVKRNDLIYAIWFALFAGIGALFHSGVIFAIPGLLLGVMLARPRGQRGKVKYYAVNLAAAIALSTVIYFANETGFGLGKFGGSLDDTLEQFERQERGGTTGGAAFPEWMRIRGGVADAWKVPIRYAAFLFSPLIPFLVRSPHHLLGVIDGALYLYLIWQIYRNWGAIKHNRAVVVLLVVLLVLNLVYALGVSNFGTAIRHRAKMSPILLLLGAGLPYLRRATRRVHGVELPRSSQSTLVST